MFIYQTRYNNEKNKDYSFSLYSGHGYSGKTLRFIQDANRKYSIVCFLNM